MSETNDNLKAQIGYVADEALELRARKLLLDDENKRLLEII